MRIEVDREGWLGAWGPTTPCSAGDGADLVVDEWAVFAGRAWPLEQDSPEPHLVGLFGCLLEARKAFAHVIFRQLPVRHGRSRWRGSAPFGATILQIEQLAVGGRVLLPLHNHIRRHILKSK